MTGTGRQVLVLVSLLIAAYLAVLTGSYFLRIECLVYRKVPELPDAGSIRIGHRYWKDPEYIWATSSTGTQRADVEVLLFPGRSRPTRSRDGRTGALVNSVEVRRANSGCRSDPTEESPWGSVRPINHDGGYLLTLPSREKALRHLLEGRVTSLYRDPDYFRPLITVWVGAAANACCTFFLLAGCLRMALLTMRAARKDRLHLVMPTSLAAGVLCTIPKVSIVPFALVWAPQPLYGLDSFPWSSTQAVNGMMGGVSLEAWMTWIYVFATVVALTAMSGGLRFASVRERSLVPCAARFSRVAVYALVFSLVIWFALSTLIYEPIRLIQHPRLFDPYSYLNAWSIG